MLRSERNQIVARKAEAVRQIQEQTVSGGLGAVRTLIECLEAEAMDKMVEIRDPVDMHVCQGSIQGMRLLLAALLPPRAGKPEPQSNEKYLDAFRSMSQGDTGGY